jgi:hypothetical protein
MSGTGIPLLAPFVPSQKAQWSPSRVEAGTRCEVAGVGRFPSAMGSFSSQAPPPQAAARPDRWLSLYCVVLSKGFKLLPPTPRAVGADGKRVSAVLMQGPNLFDFRRFLPTRGTSPGPNNVEGSLSRSRLGEDSRVTPRVRNGDDTCRSQQRGRNQGNRSFFGNPSDFFGRLLQKLARLTMDPTCASSVDAPASFLKEGHV